MRSSLMLSTATLAEDDDGFLARANFNGVSDEAKHIIFDSFASLDDNNPGVCFGLDIETVEAAEMHSVQKQQKIQNPPSSIAHQNRSDSPPCLSCSSASSINSITSMTDESTKPKRPLSAYNLFFQLERERLIAGTENTPITAEDVERVAVARRIIDELPEKPKRKHRKSHGKISFAELARAIANKWKVLDPASKNLLLERAAIEKARFLRELEEWTKQNEMVESIEKQVPRHSYEIESPDNKASPFSKSTATSASFLGNEEKTYPSVNRSFSFGRNSGDYRESPIDDDWSASSSVDTVAFRNLSIGPSLMDDHRQNLKDFAFWQRSCQMLRDESISLHYAYLQNPESFLAQPSRYGQPQPSLQLPRHRTSYSPQDIDTFNLLHDIAFSNDATNF